MALPKVVYVYEDVCSSGQKYLVATREPDEEHNGLVGIYRLEEKLEVRHQVQFRRSGQKNWFMETGTGVKSRK